MGWMKHYMLRTKEVDALVEGLVSQGAEERLSKEEWALLVQTREALARKDEIPEGRYDQLLGLCRQYDFSTPEEQSEADYEAHMTSKDD